MIILPIIGHFCPPVKKENCSNIFLISSLDNSKNQSYFEMRLSTKLHWLFKSFTSLINVPVVDRIRFGAITVAKFFESILVFSLWATVLKWRIRNFAVLILDRKWNCKVKGQIRGLYDSGLEFRLSGIKILMISLRKY